MTMTDTYQTTPDGGGESDGDELTLSDITPGSRTITASLEKGGETVRIQINTATGELEIIDND